MPPSDVSIHPHQGMHGPPKQGHQEHRHPEIQIQLKGNLHAEVTGLDDRFPEGEQRRPSHRACEPIGDQVAPPPLAPRKGFLSFWHLEINRQNARI